MKDLISKTADYIGFGYMSVSDIREWLVSEGLTEYQAWLTYKAADILTFGRAEDYKYELLRGNRNA